MKTKKEVTNTFEVMQVFGDDDTMVIHIKGINCFFTSEIREIIEEAFIRAYGNKDYDSQRHNLMDF